MTSQNANNTLEAKSLAESAKTAADSGSSSMLKMFEAMGRFVRRRKAPRRSFETSTRSRFRRIFWPSMRRLARRGPGMQDAGLRSSPKRFRNLALRSTEAAKKTEELINESMQLASEGEGVSV